MKKRLLFLGVAAGLMNFNGSAQLALETFNHAGAMPTGWTLINDANTVSTSFTSVPGLDADLDANAWYPINYEYTGLGTGSTDYQMITTSDFSPTGTANRWLITPSFSIPAGADTVALQWQDNDLGSGESIQVLVSPTAGTTAAAFTSTIYSAPAGTNTLVTHQVLLSTYAGAAPITVAFRDNTTNNWGLLLDNVQTIALDKLDLGVTTVNLPPFGQVGTSYPITGTLNNFGAITTTSVHLNYLVSGGTEVTTPLTGLSIALGGSYNYTSGTNWVPSAAGTYTIKVWADNINGTGVDENHSNDTATATVLIVNTLQPKTTLIEEFNQASCDPCADAAPNVDSVYINNMSITAMVRYHVDFPGRDCMDSVTLAPFVQNKLTYYNVDGVPDAQVDGQYVYPGAGYLTSSVVREFQSAGSPFTITVTPTYSFATQTYTFSAVIKAFGAIPAGLTAYAALTIDTITYAANQSTESIPQTMFPEVAENMSWTSGATTMTSNTLAAFTDGSTQTITGTWTKDHAWGSDRSVWSYDSTCSGQIVVWVEDNTTKYVYQAASAKVETGLCPESVANVTGNNGSMVIYPNPANKNATVALNLTTAANVQMEVFNALGQLVYSLPAEYRNSGNSLTAIDLSSLASGEYIVKVTIGDEMLSKTLTVTK